ncbi:magnesium transporter [Kaustia mangrovi]|uniref:Magnesium transporter MgtE n=1 Tax=Kaustia mangrovi TaxID=2593653 RepID=A0A7S8HDZ8_9HYPH|nr:magnesium transporter [Kaustia mangrovi]QPC44999.1 magnesium transporter [Kaustia mangrovi]
MSEVLESPAMRDEDGGFTADYVRAVSAAIEAEDQSRTRALVRDLHEADLADLIELLRADERVRLIELMGRTFDPLTFTELDESIRDELLEALPQQVIASAVRKLDTDDAVYLIGDLDEAEQREILSKVPRADRMALRRALDFPEYTAGRLMQTDFVAVPSFWSVGQTIDYMRTEKELPESFYEIYVVDPTFHLAGALPVSRVLRTPRDSVVSDIMDTADVSFTVADDQEDVAYKFEQYNLVSAPVLDEEGRLVGMLTIDDIVDVIQEEAEEDIHRLGGVGDEEITDPVWRTTRSRFTWLAVNMGTAILASWVISWFDATIDQMVALAILMPIVASMGGNAGTQTMTVAVRALATRDLGPLNAFRVIWRESVVGVINGVLFALIMGVLAILWFGNDGLGLVIGAAMIINMLAAALAGILIPLTLDWFDIDPAISSTVFVTTVTDVIGFFAFLGLAAVWLL